MQKADRVLLTGVVVEVLSLLLSGAFGWLGIDVPLIGFEDQILTASEVLRLVGMVIIFFSDRVQESIKSFRVERRNAKIAKRNS